MGKRSEEYFRKKVKGWVHKSMEGAEFLYVLCLYQKCADIGGEDEWMIENISLDPSDFDHCCMKGRCIRRYQLITEITTKNET